MGAFLFVGSVDPAENIIWGVTFSHSQAEALGLDWEKSYLALLDQVGVRHFRIPIYWDELEPTEGEFHFEKWDWQLEQLGIRGGDTILAIGQKPPRWPECRVPQWLDQLTRQEQEERVLSMLAAVVEHYRDNPVVVSWQVENEPFHKFGLCNVAPIWNEDGSINKSLIDKEIKLVRDLDPSRPVVLSESGQFSLWWEVGRRADIVGISVYRILQDRLLGLGYVRYPFPPVMYARKTKIAKLWNRDLRVIITEMQAEPWPKADRISDVSIEEQYETLSPQQFVKNIDFARRTGIDEIYLWGSEWWVWLHEQGEDEIWEEAQKLFAE